MDKFTDKPGLDEDDRAEIQRQEARDALRKSFEHGAPETGFGDDLEPETGEPAKRN